MSEPSSEDAAAKLAAVRRGVMTARPLPDGLPPQTLRGLADVIYGAALAVVPGAEDVCPVWCQGCDDDGRHVTDFAGPVLANRDDEAIARLVQDGDAAPVVELAVNDAEGGTAWVGLSLVQARELADLLKDLTAAELG